jgi:hypothetical protein
MLDPIAKDCLIFLFKLVVSATIVMFYFKILIYVRSHFPLYLYVTEFYFISVRKLANGIRNAN